MMFPRTLTALACAAAMALTLAACGGVVAPDKNQTETFTGTVGPGGAAENDFSVSKSGEFSVTLDKMDPALNVAVFAYYGQLIGGQCSPINTGAVSAVYVGREIFTGPIYPGSYCIVVADQANQLSTTITYQLTVSHP